jgi:hypothetical protein
MKREKRLTKRERKAAAGPAEHHPQHIHCIACGRHIDEEELSASPPGAKIIACRHGSRFPVCAGCTTPGQRLLDEHDRTGQPVKTADAYH